MYEVAKKKVYVPVIKEIFDCSVQVSAEEIKTRVNNIIMSISLKDIAEVLDVSLNEGKRYSKSWMKQCKDSNCIWKDSKKPRVASARKLVEECRFNHAVISKSSFIEKFRGYMSISM